MPATATFPGSTAALAAAAILVAAFAGPAAAADSPRLSSRAFGVLQQEQSVVRTFQVGIRAVFGIKVTDVAAIRVRDWSILRNQPIGLAIGNGHRGWEVEPSDASRAGYTAGWVHGSYDGCAWTATRNIGGNLLEVRGDCAAFDPPISSFTSRINCIICHGGTRVRLIAPAVEFANYRPGRGLLDPVHNAAAGQCVEWRYLSKDGSVAMVKDRRWPNNEASWVFVPRSSLPAKLPRNRQISCWH